LDDFATVSRRIFTFTKLSCGIWQNFPWKTVGWVITTSSYFVYCNCCDFS